MAAGGSDTLTPEERLIYEVWVFDTETRNGRVSQYFGNRGIARWRNLHAASEGWCLPKLKKFLDIVDRIIGEATDPETVAYRASPPIEETYWFSYQADIVKELRDLLLGS
jgi:hypothetical protein